MELREQDAYIVIRELQKQVKDLKANNLLLNIQLTQVYKQIALLTVSKKCKKIKINLNEKLASFKQILYTQEAQDLKMKEELKQVENY